MKSSIAFAASLLSLFALSGCVVVMGPGWYRPPPPVVYAAPPPCPQGFVWAPQTGCIPAPAQQSGPQPVYAQVSVPALNLRECPGKNCKSLAALDQGRVLQVLEVKDGWTRVWSPDAMREGWVDGSGLAAY